MNGSPGKLKGAEADIPGSARIAGHTAWNLFGMCAPMVVALVSIPLFIQGMGTERFGALVIVWMLVGYFGLLDFGMGRAMTKITSEYMGLGRHHLIPNIFWTALLLMGLFGLGGTVLLGFCSEPLATQWLKITPGLQGEVRVSFLVVCLGLPFTVVVTGLIGMLETRQHFRLINLIRVPLGMATYLAPLVVLPFTNSLVAVVAALISVRILEFAIFMGCCLYHIPELRQNIHVDRRMIRPLLTFGGWMTTSNIALPLMIHIDRFIVGAVRTLTDVAYYANPAEIAVKFLIIPRAGVSALFPPLTMHLARGSDEADRLFARAVKLMLLVLFPPALALVTIAPEFLHLWLGPEFARESAFILQLLTCGVFVYAMSYLAFSLLQSAGRPDLSARWHLIELPFFVATAWWMTSLFGITGMAVCWGLRGLLDVLVLYPLALRFVPRAKPAVLRAGLCALLALLAMPMVILQDVFLVRLAVAFVLLVFYAAVTWFWLLHDQERSWVLQRIGRRPSVNA